MEFRQFGSTELRVSAIGFGAWAIGGPAVVGSTAIGWGPTDDAVSKLALRRANDLGVNFFDTADFYGLGRSESLIGETFGNSDRVVIATKVGHRATAEGTIRLDYTKRYIVEACEASLRRLRRDSIDLYQLHSARLAHLEGGDCIAAMEQLRQEGKVRYWGLSLNTFSPVPEAELLMDRRLGHGFQLVLNILNRRALPVVVRAAAEGRGVVARMALQFGLLAGAMREDRTFSPDDHRSFRLTPEIIRSVRALMEPAWLAAGEAGVSPAALALGYALGVPGVSSVIPGIRTPAQAEQNAAASVPLPRVARDVLDGIPADGCEAVVRMMEARG